MDEQKIEPKKNEDQPVALLEWQTPEATVSRVSDVTRSSPTYAPGFDGSNGLAFYRS